MNRVLLKQFNFNLFSPSLNTARFDTWSSLAATFNSRPKSRSKDQKLNLSLIKDQAGLFLIPELQSHLGFNFLKEQCLTQTNQLIDEATSKTRNRKMVEVFDELSNSLCKVADLAEFIRVAHPSPLYTQAAETASGTVSGIVEKLNVNRKLYSALRDVVKHGDTIPTDEIDKHVANLFLLDFEQSGIHLPEKERNKVVALNDSLLHLGQHFVAASTNPRRINKEALPQNVRNAFALDGNNIVVDGLCADSANPLAREMAYRIYLHPDEHQDYLLTELLKARYELAQICGFPTYAHRALRGSTVETPKAVMELLDCLSEGLKEPANEDFQIMSEMKRSEFANNGALAVWDTAYFTKTAKRELFNVNNSDYSPYFSLGACMEGLNNLLQHLFGVSLVVTPMRPGECWAPDVYKIGVIHDAEGLLGHIYCDFYERSGKTQQDCHFTIQGGKMLPNGTYQHPVVVVMLNLPLPRRNTPTLLLPGMVDNLFHEMGHAMHSTLARTKYQHVTGTRCSTDFAELPAMLMEYFASDVRVLKTFARHFQTKEPMPDGMLHRLCAAKNLFTASELQVQVFYSALDQLYHSKHPLDGSTTDVLAQAQERYYGLPYVKNTAWQLRFSHLVGYGSKYYSYMVSRALASCIWQRYFEENPLNRVQGERFRNECLAHGGGKFPNQLLKNFLQTEPTTDLLVKSLLKEIDNKQYQIRHMNYRFL